MKWDLCVCGGSFTLLILPPFSGPEDVVNSRKTYFPLWTSPLFSEKGSTY